MTISHTSPDQASTWLQPNQIESLRTACYDDRFQSTHWHRNETIVTVLYDTGLRVSELVQLDVDDVDLDTATIQVPAAGQSETQTSASSSSVTLELDPEHTLGTERLLTSFLHHREDNSAVLFPSRNGGRLTPKAIRDLVTKAAACAEIRPHTPTGRGDPAAISPQTLRHSTAWRLVTVDDRSMTEVRDRLRHTALSTTRSLYVSFTEEGVHHTEIRSPSRTSFETGLNRAILEDMLDAIPDLLFAFDTDGEMLWWNDPVTDITGYRDAEVADMHPLDFVAPADKEQIAEAITRVTNQEAIEPRETQLVTKDDNHLLYEFSAATLTDDEGAVWGIAGVGRDISLRKRFERISDGFYTLDTDWRFTSLNSRAETLVDRSEEELLGTVVWEAFPDAAEMQVYDEFHTAMETQDPVSFDQYYPQLDTWFEVRTYPSKTGLSVYFRDITARKERERQLEQYRTLTEAANDVIVTINDESSIQTVNPAVTDVFGYEPDELIGEPLTMLMSDDLAAQHRAALQQYLETGERTLDWSNVEVSGLRADGSEVPISISFSEAESDGQRFFTGIVRDITDRKERERELAYRKALLEAQAETTIHGLLVVDSDRNVSYHNERFLELWDIPDSVAATRSDDALIEYVLDQLADPDEFRETVEYLYEHPEEESRDTIELVDGRWIDRYSAPVVADGAQHGRLWVFRDITDQKERERALERQRTELARLDQFNELVQDLIHAVVEESTRSEIEQTVCDQLASSDFYRTAWIGDRVKTTATITPRVSAEIRVDDVPTVTTESTDGISDLAAQAIDTRDACVVQRPFDELHVGENQDQSWGADIESALAVPIEYGDVLYGVLVVYATQARAFGDRQQASFVDLGETIGFATAAAERKEALVAERVLELTLSIRDPNQSFIQAATQCGATVTLDGIAGRGADSYLAYFTVTGVSPAAVRDLVAQGEMPDCVRVVSTHETSSLCEVEITDSSFITTVADHGGTVTDMTAENDHGTVRIELPRTADASLLLDALRATGADIDLQAKRTVDHPTQTDHRFQSTVTDRLTEKQQSAIEAAYHAGFFEQPRDSTGEDIAESLDISPSTFHQHLRVGLRKLVSPIAEPPRESA
ncbi:PAS domain S-box protein [Halomicroarcula sp. F13]|uniref:PAS domain S-box protein n=1 Tax=Haloarcula rubra TaxID=2487747 RepID=A0AAW4Q0E6_9EURY|nr:PAS domain S-box protein [Halomicroarcula rubra]MBX0326008.1 PAS domain S-box protein [Halomicroarcula rubra]